MTSLAMYFPTDRNTVKNALNATAVENGYVCQENLDGLSLRWSGAEEPFFVGLSPTGDGYTLNFSSMAEDRDGSRLERLYVLMDEMRSRVEKSVI